MKDKFSDQELEGFIDLYENLKPRNKQQVFQSRLIATIVDLQKQLAKSSKGKDTSKKTAIYKIALKEIIEKYDTSNGAVKIAKEALK